MARTTGSEDLYTLIHSLTKQEKGYFKKFATRHTIGGNNYLQLFDAINQQTKFEEKSLKQKYKGYAGMKLYLFEEILRSLMVYLQETDVQTDLLQKAVYSSILQKKGLERRAIQLTNEGLETAKKHELFLLQEFFLRNEVTYNSKNWKHTERLSLHKKAYADLKNLRAKVDNKDEYSFIANFILDYGYQKTLINNDRVDFDALARPEFLLDKSQQLSKGNNRSRLYALCKYYEALGNYPASNAVINELFTFEEMLFKSKSPLFDDIYYSLALQALVLSEALLKKFENLPPLLDKLLKQTHRDIRTTIRAKYFYCLRSLDYFWRTGKHKEGLDFFVKTLPTVLPIKKENRDFTYTMLLQVRKIMLEYSIGYYTKAILSIADLSAMDLKQHAPQFIKQALWIELLIHVNTDDYEAIKSTAKKILKKKGFELVGAENKICILFLTISPENKLTVLKEAMKMHVGAAVPIYLFECIELSSGFEAALTGVSLAETVKIFLSKH